MADIYGFSPGLQELSDRAALTGELGVLGQIRNQAPSVPFIPRSPFPAPWGQAFDLGQFPGHSINPVQPWQSLQFRPNAGVVGQRPALAQPMGMQDMGNWQDPRGALAQVTPEDQPQQQPAPKPQQTNTGTQQPSMGADPAAAAAAQAQHAQQSQDSDAWRWGLLAAGLGILANNSGHYGAAGPALGKGGLMGLQTYFGRKDQEAAQAAKQQEMQRQQQQLALNERQVKVAENADTRKGAADKRLQDAYQKYLNAATPEEKAKALEEAAVQSDPDSAFKSLLAASKPGGGGGTQYERAFRTLAELQMKHDNGTPLTAEEFLTAQTARAILSQTQTVTDPVTGQIYTRTPITIPSSISVGTGRRASDKASAAPSGAGAAPVGQGAGGTGGFSLAGIPSAVPNNAGRKPVDAGTEKELLLGGQAAKQLEDITSTFGDKYGGWMLDPVADAAMTAGRRLPEGVVGKDKKDEALWWMRYRQWANDVRAAKFGLTLTGNELTAFEGATPKPSDDNATIRKNLQFQHDLIQGKLRAQVESLRAGGYNVKQGETLAFPDKVSAPSSGIPRIKGDAEYDALPSGAQFYDPNGKLRRKP